MLRYFFLYSIVPEFTVPGNPQQNGVAEKYGHKLWSKAKTLLRHSGLPYIYWPKLVSTSDYLRIRVLHSRLPATPYKAWHNSKPYYKHLQTSNTKCWFINRLQNKQKDNSAEAILLEYKKDHIYRLLTKKGAIVRASTVKFAAEKRRLKNVRNELPVKRSCNQLGLDL
jgi:hypothetical protein